MHFNGIRGTCSGCGKALPPTHGFCASCASFADGYDSGANYVDDFEGTTEGEARTFAAKNTYVPSDTEEGFDEKRYADGFLSGLIRAAAVNAERAEECAY